MLTSCPDELPNPYKNCVREILNVLICHDNDFRRTSIELRQLQNEFQQEMDKIEFRVREMNKPVCPIADTNKLATLTAQILTIDEVNECFKGRIEELKKKRQQILETAKQCLMELTAEKCKLKQFHEKTVDYLKRFAIKSDDPQVVRNCERDICEMQKLFVKEVSHIKRCETELLPFFQQLQNEDFEQYTRCCCLKNYEWLPLGKTSEAVHAIGNDIKENIGPTLKKAFAQLHVQQPQDTQSFLAAYLMNLERNEQLLREKLTLFGNFKTK